jgi:hypothetical protein
MAVSSVLCRTQEALQLERAANASLDNVRVLAMTAATAWGREAALAERMEHNRRVSHAKSVSCQAGKDDDLPQLRHFSENPDRGFVA